MTTGLKGWLWFVLVVNAISCVSMVSMALLAPLAWISVVLEILIWWLSKFLVLGILRIH